MKFSYIHSLFGLALILLAGCKASSSAVESSAAAHYDSVSVHVVDSYHTRSIFDSLCFSIIHHDTTLRVERIFRDISQVGAVIHDTTALHQRDTLFVSSHPPERITARDIIPVILLWFLGVVFAIFVSSIWHRR